MYKVVPEIPFRVFFLLLSVRDCFLVIFIPYVFLTLSISRGTGDQEIEPFSPFLCSPRSQNSQT